MADRRRGLPTAYDRCMHGKYCCLLVVLPTQNTDTCTFTRSIFFTCVRRLLLCFYFVDRLQAAVKASLDGAKAVTTEALEWAKDKILMGAERRSAVISAETAKCTAFHEGGHAIVVRRNPTPLFLLELACALVLSLLPASYAKRCTHLYVEVCTFPSVAVL